MYTPPVTPPCSSAGITCRYELSFEIRLSVSKSPFGSDSCSLRAANVLTVCVAVRICDVAIAAAIATLIGRRTVPAQARDGAEESRGAVQDVVRRTAAEATVGHARGR